MGYGSERPAAHTQPKLTQVPTPGVITYSFFFQDPQTNTYWMIYDNKTGKLTPLGVDGYQPKDDSVTVFRLVTGASHEATTSRPTETLTESSGHKFVGLGLVFLCLLAAIGGLLVL